MRHHALIKSLLAEVRRLRRENEILREELDATSCELESQMCAAEERERHLRNAWRDMYEQYQREADYRLEYADAVEALHRARQREDTYAEERALKRLKYL